MLTQVLLGILTVASALVVVTASRAGLRSLALGANSLCLAAIAWSLSAPLVALVWAMTGLAVMLVSLIVPRGGRSAPGEAERPGMGAARPPLLTALCIGFILWVSVGPALLVGQPPDAMLVGRGVSAQSEGSTATLLAMLHTRYAAGIVGVSLTLLVAVVAMRLHERER